MGESNVEIHGSEIRFANGASIQFDLLIQEYVRYHNIYIVLLETQPGIINNENVYAIDESGRIIWRIKQQPWGRPGLNNPYVGMQMRGDCLLLNNWADRVLYVNPKTGDVLKEEITR